MPRVEALTARLATHHLAAMRRARFIGRRVERKAAPAEQAAAAHVIAGDPNRAALEIALLLTGTTGLMLLALREILQWSWAQTVMDIGHALPREPLIELAKEREAAEPPPEPEPPPDDDDDIGILLALSASAWAAWLASKLFPAPTARQANQLIYQPVNGVAWPQRAQQWAARGQVDLLNDGPRIQLQVQQGAITIGQAQAAVRSTFDDWRVAVSRIAEHEAYRLAQAIQLQQWLRLGPLLEGIVILNPLDERTRPTHRERAGTIYYVDPSLTPNLRDMPIPPDEVNCRCWLEPVLSAAAVASRRRSA